MSTQSHRERVAPLPTFRESVARGYRSTTLIDRLAEATRRDAFLALFVNAPRKPDAIHELQKAERRTLTTDERARRLIHDGIRAGYITKDQVTAYRAFQLLDDLNAFADVTDAQRAFYLEYVRETAEGLEAATEHKGNPTPETAAKVTEEVGEGAAVGLMLVAAIQRGAA